MAKRKTKKPPWSPVWDLERDGISYSLLSNFLNCRERFYHKTVRGLRDKGRKEAMEYGTIFHKLIEIYAGNQNSRGYRTYLHKWIKRKFSSLPAHEYESQVLLANIALAVFEEYIVHYKEHGEKYVYYAQEPVFREPYILPSGRMVEIRGRMDEIIQTGTGLLLQENKTKGRFNWDAIKAILPKNLQTMFYCTAIERRYKTTPVGVLYNVIRKPQEKQGKKENDADYIKRIVENIKADPTHYFKRHRHNFSTGELREWQMRTLNPNLEALYDWWESIKANPENRWATPSGEINKLHYERPFGVFDAMSDGKGELFDLIVLKNPRTLEKVETLFPELEDDEETDA